MPDRSKADERSEAPQQLQFTIQPLGWRVSGALNQTYEEALRYAAVPIPTDCGSMGTCGKCKIRFISTAPEPSAAGIRRLSENELEGGWRLACQHAVRDGATIEIAELQRGPQTAERPVNQEEALQPGVEDFEISLSPHEQHVAQDCDQAIANALGEAVRCSPYAKRAFEDRPANQSITFHVVRRGNHVLQLVPRSVSSHLLGLAIDVGTTTLAVHLYDLSKGSLMASETAYNPQRTWGADVISRIGHVRQYGDAGLSRLQHAVVDKLNVLVERVCEAAEVSVTSIFKTVVAGNPTMLHLLAGVSPVGIDLSPYTPAFLDSRVYAPGQLGLLGHPEGEVLVLPSISSYIGADIVAGVMATELGSHGAYELLVDIGTNGEIVLHADDRMYACSTAAGPAFEGAAIRDGVGAVSGAIDDVRIEGGTIRCSTINGEPAMGLCGTGLLAAAHELRKSGLIDSSGRLLPGNGPLATRCHGVGADARVLLESAAAPISITQKDIRALQLGKAAIRAGIDTLLASTSRSPSDLDRVYVAGAFGAYLSPERAIGIGLLPDVPVNRIRAVGNTAARGAAMVLLNDVRRKDADAIVKQVDYIELAADPEFTQRFLERMAFP